jgi:hypothetical protein
MVPKSLDTYLKWAYSTDNQKNGALMKSISAIILSCFSLAAANADDERIFVNASINDTPVRFIFDSGAGVPFLLFSATAQKLGLKVGQQPINAKLEPGQTAIRWTEAYNLNLGMTNLQTEFAVVETPKYLSSKWPEDGTIGWPAIRNNIFSMDCISHRIDFLTNVPDESLSWFKFRISTNYEDLSLELPANNGKRLIITIDSGSDVGVKLNSKKWQEWKQDHSKAPVTLDAYYTPNPGLVVKEVSWAGKISLGKLILTEVPVMEADSADAELHSSQTEFVATLGFAALKRLDIVIDGKQGIAYLKPKSSPPTSYWHNHLGAVFVPQDMQSNDLIGRVVEGGPAYEAGIRNEDVLLKIGEIDATKWRTDPNVLPLSRFWNSPEGTKLELTLKRGGKIFNVTAILRNILPPDKSKNSN